MNDQREYMVFNGNQLKKNEFGISPENRSFLYGDGLFESIRIFNGIPVFFDRHLERLIKGMKILKLDFSGGKTPDFKALIESLAKSNGIDNGGYARLTVFRSGGGKYLPQTNEADFIITVKPMPEKFVVEKQKIIVDVFQEIKKPLNIFSGVKSNNAQLFVMAAIYAKEKGFGDVLILNENNKIIEATSSNLFVVRGKKVLTPPLSAGPLPGIMRQIVIELLSAEGYKITERCPSENDLLSADEVFLTNAVAGIKPVTGFRTKRYFKTVSLKVVKMLNIMVENLINLPPE